jgi:hypothetical protein
LLEFSSFFLFLDDDAKPSSSFESEKDNQRPSNEIFVNLTCINWIPVYSEHKNLSQGGSVCTGFNVHKGY